MKKNESSLTSLVSAFARAYHSLYDSPKIFDDTLAKDFILPDEFNRIKENLVQGIQFLHQDIAKKLEGDTEKILQWINQVQLSPTPLARGAFCERVLHHEMALGLKQYVILGAGLDTFGFRHPELEEQLEIFEVDYPATQQFKNTRLEFLNLPIPNNLHFVPMDFTQSFSDSSLFQQGFRNTKTFFSLLGVSYYLTKEEISNLLHSLFDQVPEGSSIVFDYADENLFREKGSFSRVENMVKMAEASGEPMKSCFSYHEIEHMLQDAGLLIYEHLSPTDIQNLYFANRSDHLSAFETIHYIHAVKK